MYACMVVKWDFGQLRLDGVWGYPTQRHRNRNKATKKYLVA